MQTNIKYILSLYKSNKRSLEQVSNEIERQLKETDNIVANDLRKDILRYQKELDIVLNNL